MTDLKGFENDQHQNRIAIAAGAFFEFESLGLNPADMALYWGRLKRYSLRYIQNQIMYPVLKRDGIGVLPEMIDTIFTEETLNNIIPRRTPLNFLIDCYTLKKLSDKLAQNKK